MKYASWDIETHKVLPENFEGNIMDHRPLGITCISLLATGQDKPALFYSGDDEGVPLPRKMNMDELDDFVDALYVLYSNGYTPLAWNGNFDFQILAEELGYDSNQMKLIQEMALASVDPMFQLLCRKGFPLGLEKAAQGMSVKGKLEGMSGAQAPAMWQESEEGRKKVLDYVAQDAVVPLRVVEKIDRVGLLHWTSNAGRTQNVRLTPGMTVAWCMTILEPDTSWMSNPIPRSAFYQWAYADQIVFDIHKETGVQVNDVIKVLDAHNKQGDVK